LRGGLFINRAEALRFAMFENGRQPQAVVMVPWILELNMSSKPVPAQLDIAHGEGVICKAA
jgi:hypothetical protein